ncbi:MAG: methyltransferase domain-containing protein [Solirubrobacteraceae bacterium]|nr:methyltransferase domain-containing protein [Solirubrobacteraceae bacterium]
METLDTQRFELYLPARTVGDGLDQDEEWCELKIEGERQRIRLHDYAAIYNVPGLYEQLFSELLDCNSPEVVCDLLGAELEDAAVDPGTMRALDFGSGNGMVGELLDELGFDSLVGLDLLPEARNAASRDRPGLYDDYHVLDLSEMDRHERAELNGHDFDAMVCVAALGFGDIPPIAFAEAFNLVDSPGWIAFNIRERFVEDTDPGGFGAFIKRMFDEGILEERARVSYTHRVSVAGEPLEYVALVATKRRDVPLEWTGR